MSSKSDWPTPEILIDESVDDCGFGTIEVSPLLQSPTEFPKKGRTKQKSYRKKVETSWSHDSILKLIEEVETQRCLWDAGCVDYKLHKDSVWQEIADTIPATFKDCKAKWTNLRITFNSNLEKLRKKKSGQGTDQNFTVFWKYFKPMLFLETTKVRQSTQSTTSMQLESAITDEAIINDLGLGEEFASMSPSVSGQRRIRKSVTPSSTLSSTERNSELKEMALEALHSIRSRDSQPKNASVVFCEYIASELMTLSPEESSFARAKLRRAFNEIMEEVSFIVPQQQEDTTHDFS